MSSTDRSGKSDWVKYNTVGGRPKEKDGKDYWFELKWNQYPGLPTSYFHVPHIWTLSLEEKDEDRFGTYPSRNSKPKDSWITAQYLEMDETAFNHLKIEVGLPLSTSQVASNVNAMSLNKISHKTQPTPQTSLVTSPDQFPPLQKLGTVENSLRRDAMIHPDERATDVLQHASHSGGLDSQFSHLNMISNHAEDGFAGLSVEEDLYETSPPSTPNQIQPSPASPLTPPASELGEMVPEYLTFGTDLTNIQEPTRTLENLVETPETKEKNTANAILVAEHAHRI